MPSWTVPLHEDQMSLLDFLAAHLPNAPAKKEIKRQIDKGSAKLNGKIERFGSKKLAFKDAVSFKLESRPKVASIFDPARILFEDEALLVYNKPSGVTSDAAGILKLLESYGHFSLAHRLDKETTGALILAKTKPALDAILDAFKKKEIKKTYLAVVDGIPKKTSGVIENTLGKIGSYDGQTLYGEVPTQIGLHAKTSWVIKKQLENSALLELSPETGRTHQIRVHMAGIGHPILGDYQYAKRFKSSFKPGRLLLHAYKIAFTHPHTAATLAITAPIPPDFREALT